MNTGLIHLYYGDGKGKTTAALGLSMRCAGRNGRILFAQFLKTRKTGELAPLQTLGITVLRSRGIGKFTFEMTPQELTAAKAEQARLFHAVVNGCLTSSFDMLVMDEIVTACHLGLFDENMLTDFLHAKPRTLEVIMTGRNPSPSLIQIADYASEIQKRKHPFDRGIPSRLGIEE